MVQPASKRLVTEATIQDPASAPGAYLNSTFARGINVLHPKYGVNADGTGDDTAGIQAALDEVSTTLGVVDVYFPAGTYMIDAVNEAKFPANNRWIGGGIRPKSGTRMHLAPDAILKVIPNSSPGYSCISIESRKGITIRGGQILGDRATHDYLTDTAYPTHEWGYGVALRDASDITIEGVSISGLTGDGIFVGSVGLIGVDEPYLPSERVWIRGCSIDASRRNNISVVAGGMVLVENCVITRAGYNDGIKDGTSPRCGIDVENYGEGSVDYETALKVTVRGNRFEENVGPAILSYNAYRSVITGNYSDGTISFGFATEAIIADNVVVNTANTTGSGISSNQFTSGEYDANAVVRGNIVMGFGTGIGIQRDKVLVTGNLVTQFQSTGIGTALVANGVTISGNRITDGLGAAAIGISVSGTLTTVHGNDVDNVRDAVVIGNNATGNVVESNTITKAFRGVYINGGAQVVVKGNVLDLPGHSAGQSYDMSWANTSRVLCEGNVIRNSTSYPINAANSTGTSRIIGNRIIDTASAINLSGGRHEVIGNTFIGYRTSGSFITGAISLSGTQDKTLVMGNTVHHSGTVSYASMVYISGATTNTRVVGNTHVGTVILGGTPTGGEVLADNNIVAP